MSEKTWKVTEKRCQVVEYEIIAETYEDACKLNGEILYEQEVDNYADDIVSCKQLT